MAKKKTTTKEITESIAHNQGSPQGSGLTAVARNSLNQALSSSQAYQVSIPFRKAIDARAKNVAKARLRLFSRRTGAEILSGPAYDLFRRPSKGVNAISFVEELCRWLYLTGEMAILPITPVPTAAPSALKILDPTHLQPLTPYAQSPEFVKNWQYTKGYAVDGVHPVIQIVGEQLHFYRNFNPYNSLRGLGYAVTAINEISSNYFTQRFNLSFFKNGAKSSLIFKFPKGTKKSTIDEFIESFQARYGVMNDAGFSVGAVASDDLDVLTPGETPTDGQFLDLSQYNSEQIASLLGVPASIMGWYSRTRFDTIDAEIESFFEQTLSPDMGLIQSYLQVILDKYFTSSGTRKSDQRLSKSMQLAFEKAADENPESDIVIILDAETMPIMARLIAKKLDLAQKLRDTLMMSPQEAADYVGIDLEPDPVRQNIWVPSGLVNLSAPQSDSQSSNKQLAGEPEVIDPGDTETTEKTSPPTADLQFKAQLKAIKEAYRAFRKSVLDDIAADKAINRNQAMAMAKGLNHEALQLQMHKDYLAIRALLKSSPGAGPDELIPQVKQYINSVSKKSILKGLLHG